MQYPVRIVLERVEGRRAKATVSDQGGSALALEAMWFNADDVLRDWAQSAPKGGAYDKVHVTVVWDDGKTFETRYDLHHPGYEDVDLLKSIKRQMDFTMGCWCPPHWTQEQYEAFQRDLHIQRSKKNLCEFMKDRALTR